MQKLTPIAPSASGDIIDENQPLIAHRVFIDMAHQIDTHSHQRGQFIYASQGAVQIRTDGPTFVVPAQFAAWIPPGQAHAVYAASPVEYCCVFLSPQASNLLSGHFELLHLTTLIKELILQVTQASTLSVAGAQQRLYDVILDQLQMLKPARLALPIPSSERFLKLISQLLSDPGQHIELAECADRMAMSTRTFSRQFKSETGMAFHLWCQHLRVMKAIEMLEKGTAVTSVAFDMGYQQPSAFIAMFRRITGKTPSDILHG